MARTGLEVEEEIGMIAAEVTAQDAEGAGSVAKSFGGLLGREALDKEGAESLVLAVGRGSGFEKEAGVGC